MKGRSGIRKTLFFIALIVGVSQHLFGQAAPGADKSAADEATVYLYRIDYDPFIYSFVFSRKMSVKFSEAANAPKQLPQIASLRKNRYAIIKLKPGSYLFDTRQMIDKLKVDLAPGEVRYLRWDQGYECPTEEDPLTNPKTCEGRPAGIFEMTSETGTLEIARMKPIGKEDVKDRSLVIIPPR